MARPDFRPASGSRPAPRSPIHSPGSLVDALEQAGQVQGESLGLRWLRQIGRRLGTDPFPELYARAAQSVMDPVTTGRRIAVIGADGGTGRSTVAACLGLLYGTLRRDTTAVLDLGTGPANMAARLGVLEPVSLVQVAARSGGDTTRPGQVLSQVTRVAPGLVTAGPQPRGTTLDQERFAQLIGQLSGAAAVTLLDTPAGIDDPATRLAVEAGHAVLVVGDTSPLGVDHLHHTLSRIGDGTPVIALLNSVDRDDDRQRSLPLRLQRDDLPVVRMRWDRHLAAGGRIHLDRLSEAHRLDLARLGGLCLDAARHGGGTWR